jgi:transmembrane sensor
MKDTSLSQQEANRWFMRLRDAEATEADWLAFIDWIEGDPERRLAYDAVERAWVEIEAAPERDHLPPAANDDAPAGGSYARRPHRRWALPALAVAASAVLAIAVWPRLTAPPLESFSAGEQPRTVTLSDGSTVWLNRHSGIEARIGARRRYVVLGEGEAAFDVTHDASRPFVVQAGPRSVRVLGTAFDVIRQGDRFVVQVARGAVAVTPAGDGEVVRVTVGHKLRQSGENDVVMSTADPQTMAARRDGVLVYRDALLSEVADDLSLYLRKPVIAEGVAGNLRFSGVLKADDEATVLDQLEAFAPVRADRTSTGVRLSAR